MAIAKQDILDAIGSMTVLELSQLIKDMEEKFGVSAAAATVAVAAPGAGGGAGAAAAPPPAGAATATAAAADTPNFSSIALMRSDSSRTVIDEILSRISVCATDIWSS